MYDTLAEILRDAQTNHLHTIIAADFNAQVGKRNTDDTTTTTGKFALDPSNTRGDWLKSWAASQHLTITNTHFDKPLSDIITYYSPTQQRRQLDYILTNTTLWKRTRDAHSTRRPDLGSDHCAVRLRLDLSTPLSRTGQRQHRQRKPRSTPWSHTNLLLFRSNIDDQLASTTTTHDLNHRCSSITDIITSAATTAAHQNAPAPSSLLRDTQVTLSPQHEQLRKLIHHRQSLPNNSPQRKAASWEIRKQFQRIRRNDQEKKIEQLIQKRRGLQHITDIKRHRGRDMIPSMITQEGTATTDRQSIADVFATFYEELYQRRPTDNNINNADDHQCNHQTIPQFSLQEVTSAINQLRNGKCKDTTGLLAEMIKNGGPTLHTHLQQLYNDVISPTNTPPAQWKQTTISVLYKSGDPQLPNNYRPIAIIPLLYKLFARLLYNRLVPILDSHQTPDQAGFRHNYSTDDHLFTTAILHEKSHEWQLPLWVSAVDFKKAFDTIDHNKLWQALHHQSVPPPYIHLLQSLYSDQTATIKTDTTSRQFFIQRGVKQGDPLSSLLFNSLLEHIFQQLKQSWSARKVGIRLGHTTLTTLTNLRFADDVLLFSATLPQLTSMLNDLHDLAATCGLELHPDKTVILSNLSQRRGRQAATTVQVGGRQVQVLKHDASTKYLGRKLTLGAHHTTEIDNRISIAWRKFNALRSELTNSRYPLQSRIHLFNSTITPTILYGCASWTTTKATTDQLRTTQRRMLRLIVKTARRRLDTTALETWPDYIRRATAKADDHLHKLQIEPWPTTYLRRKWRWAARVATQPRYQWTHLAAKWRPDLDHTRLPSRRQARPCKRWSDDFHCFLTAINSTTSQQPTDWLTLAATTRWQALENHFIKYSTTSTSGTLRRNQERQDLPPPAQLSQPSRANSYSPRLTLTTVHCNDDLHPRI